MQCPMWAGYADCTPVPDYPASERHLIQAAMKRLGISVLLCKEIEKLRAGNDKHWSCSFKKRLRTGNCPIGNFVVIQATMTAPKGCGGCGPKPGYKRGIGF